VAGCRQGPVWEEPAAPAAGGRKGLIGNSRCIIIIEAACRRDDRRNERLDAAGRAARALAVSALGSPPQCRCTASRTLARALLDLCPIIAVWTVRIDDAHTATL
jgi:hypothetical protein